MPIQTDQSPVLKEITVDANGREIMDNSIDKVDARGLHISEEELQQAQNPVTTETTTEEKKEEVPKNSEAEARKLFLSAQKAERKAKEMEKKAKAGLEKSEALEKALEMTKSGQDPTALLKAVGLDPIKFYQDMTTHALKAEEKPEDPVQKELREHKERLDKYAADLEVQAKTVQEKEELAEHNRIITSTVAPLLMNNAEKYEALLTEYGNQAAAQVYTEVWTHYQKTGEMVPFEKAADVLEQFWSEKIESGINAASKFKKFANRFAQPQQTPRQSTEQPETPKSSFTLSNKQTISASSSPPRQYDRYLSADERAAEVLRKLGN